MRLLQIVIGIVLAGAGWASLTTAPVRGYALQAAEQLQPEAVSGVAYGLGFGGVIGGALLVLFAIFGVIGAALGGGREAADDPRAAQRQMETFHELLGSAAARVVGADGVIAPSEIGMVQGVVEKFGGPRIDDATVRRLAEGGIKKSSSFLARMKNDGASLSDEQKEHIVRSCLLVAMADLNVTEEESAFITEVASALGMSDAKLGEIRGGVQNVAEKLLGAASVTA